MSNINLNLYRVFYVVAQSKSYSDAAEKLYLSVPSISVSINKLEKQLNMPLFYREKDGVKLTGEGKELFNLVEQGLISIDLGEKLVLQKNDLENGEITIGCQSHLAIFYLMKRIEKAKKDYPNLRVNIIGALGAKDMLDLLEKHKLDFIVDTVPVDSIHKNVVVEELTNIQNIFVSKENLDIKSKKEFEKLDFILNFENSITHRGLQKILEKNNINIKPKIQCEITEIRAEAAKRGLGVAYVMKEAVTKELENGELFEVKVPGLEFSLTNVKLIYIKEQLTRADKKFIKKYLKK